MDVPPLLPPSRYASGPGDFEGAGDASGTGSVCGDIVSLPRVFRTNDVHLVVPHLRLTPCSS